MADNLNTAAGCRLAIGGKTSADSEAEYKADTYVDVGEIEDLGEFGDTFSSVNFTALSDGRVRKYKGTADAGNMTLTVGLDNGDAGQKAVAVAHKDRTKGNYNVKVTLNDGDPGATPAILPTTFYFGVKVMNNTVAPGSADNVVRRNMTLAINTEILEITAGPATP
ncbi:MULTISPECIES: phage tail protein [Pseudomonas]|uniref:Phage tail protein n=1 Tax=Pseudomonas sp. W17 TaxID=3144407 RepID=A0AAU7X4M3_9PSED|nr:phage tail protein [Pseudomonas protegens]MCD9572213.1 phage tail protein [Pseudomonas protegens]